MICAFFMFRRDRDNLLYARARLRCLKSMYSSVHEPRRVIHALCHYRSSNIYCHTSDATRPPPLYNGPSSSPLPPPANKSSCCLLLLILHAIDVVLWNLWVFLHQPIVNIIADIALDNDLLAPTGCLRHAAPGSELLPELLRDLLEIQPVVFKPADGRHILALVALHPFDKYLGGGLSLGVTSLDCRRFRRLLRRILGGPLLRFYRKSGEGGADGFYARRRGQLRV